jgi:hypothetical protein
MRQGDASMMLSDISAARHLYERAATIAPLYGAAASAVGRTYDPHVLEAMHISGGLASPSKALHWYTKAEAVGDTTAGMLIKRLSASNMRRP